MTNLEALKSAVNCPINDSQAELALVDREVDKDATYAGISMEFELAKADIYMMLCSSANIGEGGYSVSISEKQLLLNIAKGIYKKYGVESPIQNAVRDGSSSW